MLFCGEGQWMEQAFLLMDEGKYEMAQELLLQVEMFQTEYGQRLQWLNTYGYVLCGLKRYDEAIERYTEYISMADEHSDTENKHIGLHQMAMVYRERKDYKKALALIEEEYEIICDKFEENSLKLGANLYEQGYINFLDGNLTDALLLMKKSFAYANASKDLTMLGCSYRGLGEIYKAMNETRKSKESFAEAKKCFAESEDSVGVAEIEALETQER